jgi:hypothetical protein
LPPDLSCVLSPHHLGCPRINRRPLDDHPPAIAGGLRAVNAADNRGLCAAVEG